MPRHAQPLARVATSPEREVRRQKRRMLSRIWSAVAVQTKGLAVRASRYSWMAFSSEEMLLKLPRRMALLVRSAKRRSTWLSQEL